MLMRIFTCNPQIHLTISTVRQLAMHQGRTILDGRLAPRLERQQERDEAGHDEERARAVDRHRRRQVGVQRDDGCLSITHKRP